MGGCLIVLLCIEGFIVFCFWYGSLGIYLMVLFLVAFAGSICSMVGKV